MEVRIVLAHSNSDKSEISIPNLAPIVFNRMSKHNLLLSESVHLFDLICCQFLEFLLNKAN